MILPSPVELRFEALRDGTYTGQVVTLRGASVDIDAATLATVERGTMVRAVVATGKVEPMTKTEIKSKANGIIKALRVNVDSRAAPRPTCSPLAPRSRRPRECHRLRGARVDR